MYSLACSESAGRTLSHEPHDGVQIFSGHRGKRISVFSFQQPVFDVLEEETWKVSVRIVFGSPRAESNDSH